MRSMISIPDYFSFVMSFAPAKYICGGCQMCVPRSIHPRQRCPIQSRLKSALEVRSSFVERNNYTKTKHLCHRSLYFYAHIWSLLMILFCLPRMKPREKTRQDEPVEEINKNWINKLEHKGGSAEINYTKKIKIS